MTLTPRQSEVLSFMVNYLAEHDRLPTTRAIAQHHGVWQNTASGHIKALVKHGALERYEVRVRLAREVKKERRKIRHCCKCDTTLREHENGMCLDCQMK